MKLVMDERLKHRVVGLLVVVSIAAIFVPAIVKKSNHRFEGHSVNMISLRLPRKPPLPKVVVPAKHMVFTRAKVAHVDLGVGNPAVHAITTISKAERLSPPNIKTTTLGLTEPTKVSKILTFSRMPKSEKKSKLIAFNFKKASKLKTMITAKNSPAKPLVIKNKNKIASKKLTSKNRVLATSSVAGASYAIQLGIFSEKSNALSLLNKLKKNGYNAQSIAISQGKTPSYKILVGKAQGKEAALQLQKKLAELTALKGFIVASNKIG